MQSMFLIIKVSTKSINAVYILSERNWETDMTVHVLLWICAPLLIHSVWPLHDVNALSLSLCLLSSQNCELLQEDEKFALNKDMLLIRKVRLDDAGFYTCKLTFRLAGVIREMDETIECEVNGEHLLNNCVWT